MDGLRQQPHADDGWPAKGMLGRYLDAIYTGPEPLERYEVYRLAVSAGLPARLVEQLRNLPDGMYRRSEIIAVVHDPADDGDRAETLSDSELLAELDLLHRLRNDVFLHAPISALTWHLARTGALELEHLRRHPRRGIATSGE